MLNLLPAPLDGVAPVEARGKISNVAEIKSRAKKRFYAVFMLLVFFSLEEMCEKNLFMLLAGELQLQQQRKQQQQLQQQQQQQQQLHVHTSA